MNDWSLTDAYQQQKTELLTLEMGNILYDLLCTDSHFTTSVQELRKTIMCETGIYTPPIRIRKGELPPDQYRILLRGQQMGVGTLKMAEGSIHSEEEGKLLNHLQRICHLHPQQLLTYEGTAKWLEQAKTHSPELMKELTERGVTPGLVWSVLRILIDKHYKLYPFEELLECMLEYYLYHPYEGYIPPQWTHPYPEEIAEYIMKKRPKSLERKESSEGNVMRLRF